MMSSMMNQKSLLGMVYEDYDERNERAHDT